MELRQPWQRLIGAIAVLVAITVPCYWVSPTGAFFIGIVAGVVVLMVTDLLAGPLRVSKEGELEGLDLHEHGMVAYPEYVIHGDDPTPQF
jgi:ammonia channel protein AmtB